MNTIVLDSGSYETRAGAVAEQPQLVFPTIVGFPKQGDDANTYFGHEAREHKKTHLIRRPVEHGIVTNFEHMDKIWRHVFQKLECTPSENTVILTEHVVNPKPNREKTTQIFFEDYEVPALYLAPQEVLALRASNRTTGLILSSGYSVTHAVPILDGNVLRHGVKHMDMGGREVTYYLQQLLEDRGYSFPTNDDILQLDKIKAQMCVMSKTKETTEETVLEYELPDGRVIKVGNERAKAPEVLFDMEPIGLTHAALADIAVLAVKACDLELQPRLFQNIVINGGNTMFEGIAYRVNKEIQTLHEKIIVTAPENRINAAWQGGAMIASEPGFKDKCMTKEEYEETGPLLVHRKCF
jgi:actin